MARFGQLVRAHKFRKAAARRLANASTRPGTVKVSGLVGGGPGVRQAVIGGGGPSPVPTGRQGTGSPLRVSAERPRFVLTGGTPLMSPPIP